MVQYPKGQEVNTGVKVICFAKSWAIGGTVSSDTTERGVRLQGCAQYPRAWTETLHMAARKKEIPVKSETPTEMKLQQAVTLSRDSQGIYSLALSPNGQQLIVGFGNGAIQAVNPVDGKTISDIFSGGVSRQATTCLCFHPNNSNHLIAVGAEGIVSVYDTKSGQCMSNITVARGTDEASDQEADPVGKLGPGAHPPGGPPIGSSLPPPREMEPITEEQPLKEEKNQLYTVDISSDGATYATAGSNRGIKIYDTRTNQLINILEPADYVTSGKDLKPSDGHTRRIFALRFHPEERHIFVSGGWDDSIKIWDKRMANEARKVINGPHICGPALDIKNNKILTGSWVARNALQIWDFRKAGVEKTIPFASDIDHGEFLYAARYCTGDIVIAGGSGTNSTQAINCKTDAVLGEIKLEHGPVQTLASVLDGQHIAMAGGGGNLHIAYLV